MNSKNTLLIILSSIAIFVGLIGLFNIYQNNKTDGLNNGRITVSSCQEKDWAWRVYTCTGKYFSSGGGMVDRNNVTVTAFTREYKEGEIIPDVYAPAFTDNETTDHFVTGRERASVSYNIYWLIAVFAGVLLPIITVLVIRLNRSRIKNTPQSEK